ncbi:MAG: hypothetical protein NTZ17_14330 [Phycisphaerae bacterium]|nr:hypothetical protein [Phycisphaerae bacterium]
MRKSIDLKSVLIGGFLALLIMCVLGAAPRLMSPDSVGRFAIVTSHVEPDAYILDTVTGEVWRQSRVRGVSDAFYAPKLKIHAPGEPNKPDAR